MVFDLEQQEALSVGFDEVREKLFGKLPRELVEQSQQQRYFVLEAAAAGRPIKRWVCAWATSGVTAHPRQAVFLPPGFIVTGGGGRANWRGCGNLLTASYPLLGAVHGWQAEAKDHGWTDPASVTVWVVGMEIAGLGPQSSSSSVQASPSAHQPDA
jgi:hypothetical protein